MIRASRIEIAGFGKASGQRDNWQRLATDMQRMLNMAWQLWLCHHVKSGSADKIREHLDKFAKWKDTKQGDKPKWPVQAIDKTLSNSIYHALSKAFPGVNARTRTLLQNKWQQTISQRKAANGNLPGWVAILFANESIPSFTRPQPIAFDKENGKLSKVGDKYLLTVRIERLYQESGTVKPSLVEECELILGKRKCRSQRAIVDRILAGEYSWKGSSISYDRGKWYANLSYEMPQRDRVPLDGNKVLYVLAGRAAYKERVNVKGYKRYPSPWVLFTPGASGRTRYRFGGDGKQVEHARRAILGERASRMQHYRWAGSDQKGHGRRRAESVWTKLSSRWKDCVKRCNHEASRRIVDFALQRGIGVIRYCQPRDEARQNTLLARVGNYANSVMTWDFFQMGTLLASKCEEAGIVFEKYEAKKIEEQAANKRAGKRHRSQKR